MPKNFSFSLGVTLPKALPQCTWYHCSHYAVVCLSREASHDLLRSSDSVDRGHKSTVIPGVVIVEKWREIITVVSNIANSLKGIVMLFIGNSLSPFKTMGQGSRSFGSTILQHDKVLDGDTILFASIVSSPNNQA